MNDDALAYREVGDGRAIWLRRQFFNFQISIGKIGEFSFDDCWEFRDGVRALHAMAEWNPLTMKEPIGWVRHPPTGRRRFPDGDPATEEVRA
jgi:hypothetical protein